MGPKRNKSGTDINKRRSISLETKLDIIKRAERGEKQVDIARHYGANRSTIATIIKDKERLVEAIKQTTPVLMSRIVKNRRFLLHEMEKLLILWIERQTHDHVPLGPLKIQEKAKILFEDLKKRSGPEFANDNFSASSGWFSRFKGRANLHNSLQAELPEAGCEIPKVLEQIIAEDGYSAQQVFNVYETRLFWKKMTSTTYMSRDDDEHKASKERLTLFLGSNAAGDFKLQPFLVYVSENPRAFKGIAKSSLPVLWKSNRNAWMTKELFEDWFKNYFVEEIQKYCASKKIPFKILLLLDNPSYILDLNDNIKLFLLPPNTVQPMDGIVTSFKAYYLRRTFSEAIVFIDKEGKNLQDFWKTYTILNAVQNVADAWADVKEVNLRSVWENLCPQFVHNLSDNETVIHITKQIVELGNKMDLDLNVADVKELMGTHIEELTTDDLIEIDNSGIDAPRTFTTEKMAGAFKCISDGLAMFEEEDGNLERVAKVKKDVYECLACYSNIFEERKLSEASINTTLKQASPDAIPSTSAASSVSYVEIVYSDEDIDV